MTDSDDKLSRRYRELPREEPGADLDSAILAASRRAVGARPGARKSNWMVPTSIAAVLVLGIGVSLRMQLEQPGVETSVPSSSSAEYPVPPSAEPAPTPKLQQAPAPEAPPAPAAKAKPESKVLARRDAAPLEDRARAATAEREVAKPLAKEAKQSAPEPIGVKKDAAEVKPFAEAPASAPPPPAEPSAPRAQARVESTTAAGAAAPSAQAAPAPRAKREAIAADNTVARESQPRGPLAAIADPDPARELERIARLREATRHEEADRALKEFQRRHPDYRIPEAMWQRVKPR
jgi:hypothetical protein